MLKPRFPSSRVTGSSLSGTNRNTAVAMGVCGAPTARTRFQVKNWHPNFRGNQLFLNVLKTHVYVRYMHVFYTQIYVNLHSRTYICI